MTQATAALFGVVGMFIIYKLQSLRDSVKNAERDALDALQRIGLSYAALERKNSEEIEAILKERIRDKEKIAEIPDNVAYQQVIDKKKNDKELHFLKGKKHNWDTSRDKFKLLVKWKNIYYWAWFYLFLFSNSLAGQPPTNENNSRFYYVIGYLHNFINNRSDLYISFNERILNIIDYEHISKR